MLHTPPPFKPCVPESLDPFFLRPAAFGSLALLCLCRCLRLIILAGRITLTNVLAFAVTDRRTATKWVSAQKSMLLLMRSPNESRRI